MKEVPNHYQVLGVERSAGEANIQAAFSKAEKTLRPKLEDEKTRRSSKLKLTKLGAAAAALGDPQARAEYDQSLSQVEELLASLEQSADMSPSEREELVRNLTVLYRDFEQKMFRSWRQAVLDEGTEVRVWVEEEIAKYEGRYETQIEDALEQARSAEHQGSDEPESQDDSRLRDWLANGFWRAPQ